MSEVKDSPVDLAALQAVIEKLQTDCYSDPDTERRQLWQVVNAADSLIRELAQAREKLATLGVGNYKLVNEETGAIYRGGFKTAGEAAAVRNEIERRWAIEDEDDEDRVRPNLQIVQYPDPPAESGR